MISSFHKLLLYLSENDAKFLEPSSSAAQAIPQCSRDPGFVARMAGNNRGIVLTGEVRDQCVRWDCQRIPSRPNEYCCEICARAAASDGRYNTPIGMSIVYSSAAKFAPVATKILNLLKVNKESGVPQLSPELFKIPPWQSSMFTYRPTQIESFFEWMFISSQEIPHSSDFKWNGGRPRTIGEVELCVFRPSPDVDEKWKLHHYSIPGVTDKAVYVMHLNNDY